MGGFIGAPNIVDDSLIFLMDINNLQSYVPGSSNISDLSPYNSVDIGTLYNNVSYGTSWGVKYLEFDGTDDYVRVTRSDLNGSSFSHQLLTVCVWLYPSSESSTNDNNVLTVENAFEFRFNNRNNGYASLYYASNPWAWRGSSSDLIETDKWSMFTFVHASSYRKMYVNNTEVYNSNDSGNIQSGSGSYPYMTIGARRTGTTSDMKGRISCIQMYDRPLDINEITQNYNALKGRFGLN